LQVVRTGKGIAGESLSGGGDRHDRDIVIVIAEAGAFRFQDADDIEGCPVDANGLADRIIIAEQLFRDARSKHHDPCGRPNIGFADEASGRRCSVGDLPVTRSGADGAGRCVAACHDQLDRGAQLRRDIGDAANLLFDRIGIPHGQAAAVKGGSAPFTVRLRKNQRHVGTKRVDRLHHRYLRSGSHGHSKRNRKHPDHHTQRGQYRPHQIGPQRRHRNRHVDDPRREFLPKIADHAFTILRWATRISSMTLPSRNSIRRFA